MLVLVAVLLGVAVAAHAGGAPIPESPDPAPAPPPVVADAASAETAPAPAEPAPAETAPEATVTEPTAAMSAADREAILAEIAELRSRLNDLTQRLDASPPPAPPADDAEEDYPTSDISGDMIVEYQARFGENVARPNTFELRRFWLTASGKLREDTTYKIQGAVTTGSGDDIPRDVYIDHQINDESSIRIGQWEMPMGYSTVLDPMTNPLPAASLINEGGTWNGWRFYGMSPNRQIGAMYQYRDDHNLAQFAIYNGNGRNDRDENSAKDVNLRYNYISAGKRHEAGLAYRRGAQFDQSLAANLLETWGLEYRYNGRKNVVMVEAMTGNTRGNGALVDQTGYAIDYVYWPDGSKPQAWWPSKGSGDEFYTARWEQAWRNNDYTDRCSIFWLGYGKYHSDDWRTQVALGLQRYDQRLYVTTIMKF